MKKYENMGMKELRARVLNKYSEILNTGKPVFVVSTTNYFGSNYGLFDEETTKDFDRKDLELLLNKYSAVKNIIELDDIIIIHDGNSQKVIVDFNGDREIAVWTGKEKRDGSKEILNHEGSWSWRENVISLDSYKDIVKSKIDEIIDTVNNYSNGKDYSAVIRDYYSNLLEEGIPEFDKILIDTDEYCIALSNESEDYYDQSRCMTQKYLDNYCYPTLVIEKKNGKLTPLQIKYSTFEELNDEARVEYQKMLDTKILKLLDTNELQIEKANTYNLAFDLWNHRVYLAFDSVETGEMRYEIYNKSTGTKWQGKIYGPKSTTFSIYREAKIIEHCQERYLGDVIKKSLPEAKSELRNYFQSQKINDSYLLSELIVYLIIKLMNFSGEKSSKESIMNIFR